jgi:general secretion pathway protein J
VALQAGVAGMTLRTWQGGQWRSATGALTSANATTAAAAAGVPEAVATQVPTGLEVALQMQGQNTALVKVFLLESL